MIISQAGFIQDQQLENLQESLELIYQKYKVQAQKIEFLKKTYMSMLKIFFHLLIIQILKALNLLLILKNGEMSQKKS